MPQTLQKLQDSKLTPQLADPNSQQLQQAPYAANWHRSIKPEFGVGSPTSGASVGSAVFAREFQAVGCGTNFRSNYWRM
jgi:hypothetical protein